MAPRKATYVGLACLGLVSAAPGAADGGVTTLKLKRGAAAEEHPDTAVLREVHFIRRRYEEARALLELEGAGERAGPKDEGAFAVGVWPDDPTAM